MSIGNATPYIELNMAGLQLNSSEDNIIDMTNERVDSSVSRATVFTLYDDTALILENQLQIVQDPSVEFVYGYDGISRSKKYVGKILTYSIEFVGQGIELTIQAQAEASILAMNPRKDAFKGLRIDEIIKKLADIEGWKYRDEDIVECEPIYESDKKGKGRDNYRVYYQENESTIEFINNKLIPDAITPEKIGSFQFRIDEEPNGDIYAYFRPLQYKAEEAQEVKAHFTYNLGAPNEDVLSFRPEFSKVLSSLLGSAKLEGEVLNNDTGEYLRVDLSTKQNDNIISGQSGNVPAPISGDKKVEIVRRLSGVSYSSSHLEAIARNTYQRAAHLAYPADLKIRGNVELNPDDVIEMTVITKQGKLHHSSGKYRITTIKDIVGNGIFNSELKLYKEVLDAKEIEVTITGPGAPNEEDVTPTSYSGKGRSSKDANTVYKREPNKEVRRVGNKEIPKGVPDSPVLKECLKYLGIPYKYGGDDVRTGMDCSAFSRRILKAFGVQLPRVADDQCKKGTQISLSSAKPGDLCFFDYTSRNCHVAVYLGNGYICEEPKTGYYCWIKHLSKKGKLGRVCRYPLKFS